MARHRVASSSSSASVSSRTRRAGAVRVSAALGDIERARGQDYASAAECFVEAFFLARRSKSATEITKGELAYLNGAQKKDMVSRYNQRGLGTMLVIKDDEMRGAVVACVGVEVQTFKGTVPLRRAEENSKGEVMDRPVIANLATAPSARRKGLAKKLMRAVEEQCVEWGFEEAVLVVEANNSKARGLYKKVRMMRGLQKHTGVCIEREFGKRRRLRAHFVLFVQQQLIKSVQFIYTFEGNKKARCGNNGLAVRVGGPCV